MRVSPITETDLKDLKELQPEGWPDIIPHFKFYISSSFCRPIKFVQNNRIKGIGSAILHKSTAWLGHIIVHRDYRNKGLGTLITKTLVERLQTDDVKAISLIATDLGEPVYKKIGFVTETNYHFLKNDSETPFDNTLTHKITSGNLLASKILEMDKFVFGEDRELLLNQHIASAQVCVEGDKLLGFYLPALNEGLIVATNPEAGIQLLKSHVAVKNVVILPIQNENAIQFLSNNGFQNVRSAARMRMGTDIGFRPDMLFNRIGGNLG